MPNIVAYIYNYALLGNHSCAVLGRIGSDMDNLRRARLRAVTAILSEVETSLTILWLEIPWLRSQ